MSISRKYTPEYYQKHKETWDRAAKKWRQNNKGKVNSYVRAWNTRHPNYLNSYLGYDSEALFIYMLDILNPNHECVWCGESDPRCLQRDHINGGGTKERRTSGYDINKWIITHQEEARKKFQILCANCNWRKRWENHEYRQPETYKRHTDSEQAG